MAHLQQNPTMSWKNERLEPNKFPPHLIDKENHHSKPSFKRLPLGPSWVKFGGMESSMVYGNGHPVDSFQNQRSIHQKNMAVMLPLP